MPDPSDGYRQAAAKCVAIARSTSDPHTRVKLMMMAQRWFDMANGSQVNFEAILRGFNDQHMVPPAPQSVAQQQQQIQPKNQA